MKKLIEIPLNQITIAENVRKSYDENAIKELAQSIDENGLSQPVAVFQTGEKSFELLYGQRRFLAFQTLQEKSSKELKIPCILQEKKLSESERIIVQTVENIQREGLSSIDTENAIYELKKSGLKQNEIAQKLGVGKASISQAVKAYEIRKKFSRLNFDKEVLELPTSVIAEFAQLDEKQLKKAVTMAIDSGGSQKAARAAKRRIIEDEAKAEKERKSAERAKRQKKAVVKPKKKIEIKPGHYESKEGNIFDMLGQIENEKNAVILQGGSGKFYKVPVKTFLKEYKKI